jgi:DNA-binding NarL/FixJ family response regulator
MDGTGETRVLIVGEDPLARGGLALMLASEPGIAVARQVPPGAEDLLDGDPEVVVWDLGPGAATGLDRLTALAGVGEGAPILVLISREETAAEVLAAGARGILFREVDGRRLAAAVRAVARGLLVFDDGLAAALLRDQPAPPPDLAEPLTPREVEVLQLLARGLSNRVIGDQLGISEHTAKFHVNAILGKLGAQGRTDAVVRAARLGLILL